MTTVHLGATIIQFRETEPDRYHHTALRVQTFKGCLLGHVDTDGYDLVAAFRNDSDAWRFLVAYYDGDMPDGPGVGQYILSGPITITE